MNLPCNFNYKLCMGCTIAGKRWNKAENWDTQDTAVQDLIKHEVNTKNSLLPGQEGNKFYQRTVFSLEIAHTLNPGGGEAFRSSGSMGKSRHFLSCLTFASGPSSILHPVQGFQLEWGGDQGTTPIWLCLCDGSKWANFPMLIRTGLLGSSGYKSKSRVGKDR